jgi:hypothetical protein
VSEGVSEGESKRESERERERERGELSLGAQALSILTISIKMNAENISSCS